jgi:hypothetical protein
MGLKWGYTARSASGGVKMLNDVALVVSQHSGKLRQEALDVAVDNIQTNHILGFNLVRDAIREIDRILVARGSELALLSNYIVRETAMGVKWLHSLSNQP